MHTDWSAEFHVVWDVWSCVFVVNLVEVYSCLFVCCRDFWQFLDCNNEDQKLPRNWEWMISYAAKNLSLWRNNRLFPNEYDDYDSHLIVFSDLLLYFITEVTYLEWEIGSCNGDEESSMKGLWIEFRFVAKWDWKCLRKRMKKLTIDEMLKRRKRRKRTSLWRNSDVIFTFLWVRLQARELCMLW